MDTNWIAVASHRISVTSTAKFASCCQPSLLWQCGNLLKPRTVPAFVTTMAAQSVAELPESDDWIYELKLDGSPYFWWCY
jgi:ATP-dependent DNA ligase